MLSSAEPLSASEPGSTSPYVLTWGLLGPGKGIERVIDAMTHLQDIRPRVRYVVAGCTHPKVRAAEGERYREMLVRRSWRNGTAAHVTFDASYRDLPSLTKLLHGAAVVVLPYDSCDQATSGVLVDAVAAGRPVIATAFPHAIELLSTGAGIVVPHDDSIALELAIRRVFCEPGSQPPWPRSPRVSLLSSRGPPSQAGMTRSRATSIPSFRRWRDDASGSLVRGSRGPHRSHRHLRARGVLVGVPHHGYCTDDVARLLLVGCRATNPTPGVQRLVAVAVRFLADGKARTATATTEGRQMASGQTAVVPATGGGEACGSAPPREAPRIG